MSRLTWTDVDGDTIVITEETVGADPSVIATALITSENRRDEAAIWMTREQAAQLRDWLNERLER